jgi:hypothetical protein
MEADTRSLQNLSVTRISLQFPLNRNTLAPCHRHGEKEQEEERKSGHNKRKTNTSRKNRLSFLPFPPAFFPLLQRGFVIVLKDRQLSTKKKTSSFPPANQSFVLSLHGQLTDFFSHRTTERRRSVTHRMDPRLFQKPNSSANLMRIGFSGRSSGR